MDDVIHVVDILIIAVRPEHTTDSKKLNQLFAYKFIQSTNPMRQTNCY